MADFGQVAKVALNSLAFGAMAISCATVRQDAYAAMDRGDWDRVTSDFRLLGFHMELGVAPVE